MLLDLSELLFLAKKNASQDAGWSHWLTWPPEAASHTVAPQHTHTDTHTRTHPHPSKHRHTHRATSLSLHVSSFYLGPSRGTKKDKERRNRCGGGGERWGRGRKWGGGGRVCTHTHARTNVCVSAHWRNHQNHQRLTKDLSKNDRP